MSLATALMEGTSLLGMSNADMARYNCDDGHRAIYAETAYELADVFESTWYASEQVEFQAMYEGTTVAESWEYTELMENIITNGFERIAAALKALWNKIKAFFANIKSHFVTITRDNATFVEKFNNQIAGEKLNLAGFTYNMYNYTALEDFQSLMDTSKSKAFDACENEVHAKIASTDLSIEDQNSLKDSLERIKLKFLKDVTGTDDETECNDKLWSSFRGGARPGDKKPGISISSLDTYLAVLKSARTVKEMDEFAKNVDKDFKKKIGEVKAKEKEAKKNGNSQSAITTLKNESQMINKICGKANQFISIWRNACIQRNSDYRNLCHAAYAYSRGRK